MSEIRYQCRVCGEWWSPPTHECDPRVLLEKLGYGDVTDLRAQLAAALTRAETAEGEVERLRRVDVAVTQLLSEGTSEQVTRKRRRVHAFWTSIDVWEHFITEVAADA